MPELGVYLVKPACKASMAACLICSGVSKSGSPAPKPQTSSPSAFIAFALLSIERVSEGVSCAARAEISMSVALFLAVEAVDCRFEIVFVHSHDAHLALRILDRVRSVRGVDHDGLSELLSD